MSEFAGLNIALSSLLAQRRGLELTGHNIANANTDGYSRQRVELQAVTDPVAGFFSRTSGVGQGVQVESFTRFRDQFLEVRGALEHGAQASLGQMKSALGAIEDLFKEPSDQSVGKNLSDFWAAWDDVANQPDDPAARQQLLERATGLTTTLNQASSQLTQMRADTISKLTTTVSDVNSLATNVAQLNAKISAAVTAGINASDLQDQRDLLVGQLADKVGATIRPGQNGQVDVYVNGTSLVTGNLAQSLTLDTSGSPVVVRWSNDNYPATITGGDTGGLLQVVNVKLPTYQSSLDTIATTLRDQVNTVFAATGGSIPAGASQNLSAAGNLQFQIALNNGAFATATVAGADWSGAGGAAALQTALQNAVNAAIGAGNATVAVSGGNGSALTISLTPTGTNTVQLQASGANIGLATLLGSTPVGLDGIGGRQFFTGTNATTLAVSSAFAANANAIPAGTAGNGPLDGSVALTLADAAQSATGADALYRSFVGNLGLDSQQAQRAYDVQTATVQQVDGARQSYSGVSTDEEMTAMVEFQHAYEAAARFMTTVDSILDTLINRTGLTA